MTDSPPKRFNGNPGDTVWFHEMYEDIPHLYLIVTPPERGSSRALIVNVTTKRSGSDNTVILSERDHPSIKHPSAVNYNAARIVSINWLKKEVDVKIAWPDVPFQPGPLSRIQDGVLESPFTSPAIKHYFLRVMGLSSTDDD